MGSYEWSGTDKRRTGTALHQLCKGVLDFAAAADIENAELLPDLEARRQQVSSFRLGFRRIRVHEHANRRDVRHKLAQQLQSLCPYLADDKDHAGDIATGAVKAGDKAVPDRVTSGDEHGWHCYGCGLGRDRRRTVRDDYGHRLVNQVSHQLRQLIITTFRKAQFNRDVLTLNIAGFRQALAERRYEVRRVGERGTAEETNYWRRRLLCARSERPSSRRAADKRDEIASLHRVPLKQRLLPYHADGAWCSTANLDQRCPLWVKSGH